MNRCRTGVEPAAPMPGAGASRLLYLLGAGGHAREVLATLRALGFGDRVAGMVEQQQWFSARRVGDVCVVSDALLDTLKPEECLLVGAIGSPARRDWFAALQARGLQYVRVVHPSVQFVAPCAIGEGAYIAAGTIITTDVEIGAHVVVNIGCMISHDTVLSAFCTLAPGVRLSGGVAIGEGAFLGTGVTVIERVRIGAGSIVAAGACVVDDVPEGVLVAGVPARTVRELRPGESVRFRA